LDASASLKQTLTHLFDAARHSSRAKELEGAASKAESDLMEELNRLEAHIEEVTNLLGSMGAGTEGAVKDLSRQVEEFLETAKLQAVEKLEKRANAEVGELRESAAAERDRALKSLESYLASEPLPVVDSAVYIRLSEGIYEAKSTHQCEGGMKYDFRLATQNSPLFGKEFHLSQLDYELRIPVRLSRTLLKKESVPGFERLDQYVLATAEASAGKVRANFEKEGNGAKFKIMTSGLESDGFVGIEYTDQAQQVNVMTDPSLGSHLDLEAIKRAMGELGSGLTDLSSKKLALLRLSLGGEDVLSRLDCEEVLKVVLKVMGPVYQATIRKISNGTFDDLPDLTIDFIRERLKVLGGSSSAVASALGFQVPR
jgi:hypothetical protein